jgi:hypothetical protein
MSKRFSIVGVYPDGRRTKLLVNVAEDEAALLAVGIQQGATDFVRIDVVAETPRVQWPKPRDDGQVRRSNPDRI